MGIGLISTLAVLLCGAQTGHSRGLLQLPALTPRAAPPARPTLPNYSNSAAPPPSASNATKDPERIDVPLRFPNDTVLTAYPDYIYSGDRGCSPSALLSFLTIEKQVVPLEEYSHYALRLLQTPSNSPNSVPDSVTYFDLETANMVVGIPKLDWLQQTQNFNYTQYIPGLVNIRTYRLRLQTLTTLITGLAIGKALNTSRYACSTANPELVPMMQYLTKIQSLINKSEEIDNGLKKGIEYRVPSGCIVELDAYYAGNTLLTPSLISGNDIRTPTEDDCCSACRGQSGCNVFTFCPSFQGCQLGEKLFPAFTCELKQLNNLTTDPADFPAAILRGPPTAFKSGRLG